MMDFDEYQELTATTAVYPGQGGFVGLAYATLGLNGETGEFTEKVKKLWRDDGADIKGVVLLAIGRFERNLGFRAPETMPFHFGILREEIEDSFIVDIPVERRAAMRKELGDILWYVSQVATEIGVELGDIARENIDKLRDRHERDVIHGDGDER